VDPQERIAAFWAGERPDQIPYTIYWNEWRHTRDNPAWGPMFAAGLRVTYGVNTAGTRTPDVESLRTEVEIEGRRLNRQIMRTPVGEIHRDSAEGWVQKHWLETAEDYRVMRYIVDHTEVFPNYEAFFQKEKETSDHGIVHVSLGRTPLQTIWLIMLVLRTLPYTSLTWKRKSKLYTIRCCGSYVSEWPL
jgi:hypothetical protein